VRKTTRVETNIVGQDTSGTDNVPEMELEEDLESEDVVELKERVRQLAAQKKASEQKVANLRTQLSRAHYSLQTYRGDVPNGRPA
jgi:Ran GTPase-activating protein (RanGAP) involved in mRNA processing and transport